jgi:hypothetical protein
MEDSMDVTSIASQATTIANTASNQGGGVAQQKRAAEVQATNAAAMSAALPPVTSTNLPAHIGNNINTTA